MTTDALFDIGLLEAMDKNLVKNALKLNPRSEEHV